MQRLVRPGLNVRVVPDGVEIALINVPALNGMERREYPVDAKQRGDRRVLPEGQSLGEIPDITDGVDPAKGRRQLAGDQPRRVDFPAPLRPTSPVRPVVIVP
ncbi:hypothetical protein [Arthrobacter sp. MMS18-M83]|uniref:hypothetical protein n=1 Tax=Arthrobacter sp. MMS18-M83 TaxID=2996261 RepID=UPI003FA349A8